MKEPKMRLCANCGTRYPVADPRCPDCGTHAQRSRSAVERSAPMESCAWVSDRRCNYPATMSSTTLGEGPWYCQFHFECSDPIAGADIVAASRDYTPPPTVQGRRNPLVEAVASRILAQANTEAKAYCQDLGLTTVTQMRAHIAKTLPKVGSGGGNLDWARKIMARIQAGESLPMISEQKARQALGLPTIAEAERDKRTERDALEAQFPALQALR